MLAAEGGGRRGGDAPEVSTGEPAGDPRGGRLAQGWAYFFFFLSEGEQPLGAHWRFPLQFAMS
jgi:hypothetical protein